MLTIQEIREVITLVCDADHLEREAWHSVKISDLLNYGEAAEYLEIESELGGS